MFGKAHHFPVTIARAAINIDAPSVQYGQLQGIAPTVKMSEKM